MVGRIVAVLRATPAGRELAIADEVPDGLALPMPEAAALETLGALIENAVRHASTRVTIHAGDDQGRCWITIADDGAGIPEDLRQAALERGARLDERSGSHGLGLSIAQELVKASGGSLALDAAAGGGLIVRIEWSADT